MKTENDYLREIVHISTDLVNQLGSQDETHVASIKVLDKISFDLHLTHFDGSEEVLRHLNLSPKLHSKIEAILRGIAQKLQAQLLEEGRKLLLAYEWNDTACAQISQLLQKMLDSEMAKNRRAVINVFEEKVHMFKKEVNSMSDVESSGESSVAQKGHSPRAIAILEKVFAQTTNINRSEKLQLAKATKLEPRQVTIWFQNRRNRKPTAQVQSGNKLNLKPSTFIQQRKRKFDETEDKFPQTPKQRRRLSETDIVSLTSPSSSRNETPFSTSTCDRSSSVELFETSQVSSRSLGGTSCGTSYDDNFSSFQSEDSSPPRSTFGMNSFDDQIVRFTNAKKIGRSGDDKKEMMFNENGDVVLDWDDLELNLEDFNDSVSQVATPNFTFPTNNQLDGIIGDVTFPKTHQETNDLILSFARQLVEENFSAQQSLEQVQESEGWQVQVFDRIFLAKEPEQDVISLNDLQSSQSSNPSGPSTSNSTQTSPRSGTPRNLFNFDFEGLGLNDIMTYNNESIQQNIDSVNLFAPDEMPNFEPATSDILGLLFSPTPASASTDAQLLAPPA